jgi:hypothetical protein
MFRIVWQRKLETGLRSDIPGSEGSSPGPFPVHPLRAWPLEAALAVVNFFSHRLEMASLGLTYRLSLLRWYRPRPDDVFVVSFPKSGTTLMQMMLYQLTTDGSMDFGRFDSVSPWFEMSLGWRDPSLIARIPSPRIFKSHALFKKLPRGSLFLYLVRDPADVAVSSFHHHSPEAGLAGDLARYLDRFLEDPSQFDAWARHIQSWWPHRGDPNVLFLSYDQVIRDLEGTVRRVAAFCGFALREEEMPRILERCGLAFMKQHTEKLDPRSRQLGPQREEFIRKGRAGSGEEALSPAQREKLARKMEALARRLGCTTGELVAVLKGRGPAA